MAISGRQMPNTWPNPVLAKFGQFLGPLAPNWGYRKLRNRFKDYIHNGSTLIQPFQSVRRPKPGQSLFLAKLELSYKVKMVKLQVSGGNPRLERSASPLLYMNYLGTPQLRGGGVPV